MARQSELAQHLGEVQLFSKCSKRDLEQIAKQMEVLDVPDGTAIVRQGGAGDTFYVLLEGDAVVRRNGSQVGELHAGAYFGELALLDPAPRNADVVAASDAVVGKLTVDPFRTLLREVPALNERLLAGLAHRLREADRRDVR